METERVINKRYALQHILTQGQVCTVYQGFDQVLHRLVAVKVVPAAHIPEYRAALRMTAQFSHPNIIGTYDLLQEPETLYVVQEYVEGDDFSTLLQTRLSPYAIADLGTQICLALLYAGSPSRQVCHGDLTPSTIVRNRRGLVRVNDFALPSDLPYFTSWSVVGGDGITVSDRDLQWGQMSDGRRADDTRAVGLLLYQLLAARAPGATSVEPPADGRLHFLRNIPIELCEIIARTVVRQHPQHIDSIETLYEELKPLADAFESPVAVSTVEPYQTEEILKSQQFPPIASAGKLVTALPMRENGQAAPSISTFSKPNSQMAMAQQARTSSSPSTSQPLPPPTAPAIADVPLNLATARPAPYAETYTQPRSLSIPVLLLLGLLLFAAFFVVGYLAAHAIFP